MSVADDVWLAERAAEPGNRCCIVGAGPAGVMLGYLLARVGIPVVVIEKHADFLRDFRGDTVHPSTLQLLHELGLLQRFLERPHQQFARLSARIGDEEVDVADFSHLPTAAKFLVVMPQSVFLGFLAAEAHRFPCFSIEMSTEATGLVADDGVIRGVTVRGPGGTAEIRARLVIGADGRRSRLRELARLPVVDLGAPIDMLWFRMRRRAEDRVQPFGQFHDGRIMVMIDRGDYYQCGLVVPKGAFDGIRAAGLGAFRQLIAHTAPLLADRTVDVTSWEEVKLFTVSLDRLRTWHRPGLVCIGDAAHAMSPIGGVGINLAIQDAVATANVLGGPLSRRELITPAMLARVEERRRFPTCATQRLQMLFHRIVMRALAAPPRGGLPLPFRLLRRFPRLRRVPARILGLGFRPEHVRAIPPGVATDACSPDGGYI